MSPIGSGLLGIITLVVLMVGGIGFVAGPLLWAAVTEKSQRVQWAAFWWSWIALGVGSGVVAYVKDVTAWP